MGRRECGHLINRPTYCCHQILRTWRKCSFHFFSIIDVSVNHDTVCPLPACRPPSPVNGRGKQPMNRHRIPSRPMICFSRPFTGDKGTLEAKQRPRERAYGVMIYGSLNRSIFCSTTPASSRKVRASMPSLCATLASHPEFCFATWGENIHLQRLTRVALV